MIKYVTGSNLKGSTKLITSMFRDRALQFSDRLNWSVNVDKNGEERDQYDLLNPIYVIWELPDGTHGGSLRLMPTIGRTMLNDCFSGILDHQRIESPRVWEVTRFCLSQRSDIDITSRLILAAIQFGCTFDIPYFVGVFGENMVRVYSRLGFSPVIIGTSRDGESVLSVGLWEVCEATRVMICKRIGVHDSISASWTRSLDNQLQSTLHIATATRLQKVLIQEPPEAQPRLI